MTPFLQISLGSALLLFCVLVHILCILGVLALFRRWRAEGGNRIFRSDFLTVVFLILTVLGSHTVQVYLWAFALWLSGALTLFSEAVYFALASYTTLGYGDVLLPHDWRIFGAMSAVLGMLVFGMSTAFLVGFFQQMISESRGRR